MKIVIVGGAGGIGSSVAFNLVRGKVAHEVVIVDTRPNMVTSQVMDLQDAVSLGGLRVLREGTPADALDADIVVVSAAVPLRLNTSRDVFLLENARLLEGVIAPLVEHGWPGILLLMTNPVDTLLTWIARRTGWARQRLLGYTLNDSQRLRFGVARVLGVAPQRVSCWVVGEHGAGQVPVWSTVRVDGAPVQLDDVQRAEILDYVDNWYARHVALDSGRTSTWSTGLGGALMIEAIVADTGLPFPASVVLDGEYEVDGVSSSVPVLLSPSGAVVAPVIELDEGELRAFHSSATRIGEQVTTLESALLA